MRVQKIILILFIIIIFLTGGNYFLNKDNYLFQDLYIEDINCIYASFGGYPNYEISYKDQEKLIKYLKNVTYIRKTDEYKYEDAKTYNSKFIINFISKEDISIEVSTPYIIVNSIGYYSKDSKQLSSIELLFSKYIDIIKTKYDNN